MMVKYMSFKYVRSFLPSSSIINSQIFRNQSNSSKSAPDVFNSAAKVTHRDRAALRLSESGFIGLSSSTNYKTNENSVFPSPADCDYFRDDVSERLIDRVQDLKAKRFDVAVDWGCGRAHLFRQLHSGLVKTLYQCDNSPLVLQQADTIAKLRKEAFLKQAKPIHSAAPHSVKDFEDESDQQLLQEPPETFTLRTGDELLPFAPNSVDLVLSNLALHWVNDLPTLFKQVNSVLKPDGVFLFSMIGPDTLFELRVALQLAELEREGGFGAHVSPFTEPANLTHLLQNAGFQLITVDVDHISISYPTVFELMRDLRAAGEQHAAHQSKPLRRETLLAAAAIYSSEYASEHTQPPGEGRVERPIQASFNVLFAIGWKPGPDMKRARDDRQKPPPEGTPPSETPPLVFQTLN